MRWDEAYKPRPRSMQAEFPGLGADGERDVREAEEWITANPGAWAYMTANAERLSVMGCVSANYLVNMVRNELRVSVKNGLAPSFARIMERERPALKGSFRMHRSRSDGFAL